MEGPFLLATTRLRRSAALLVSAVVLAVAATSTSGASPSADACRVRNLDTGATARSLQEAVTLAHTGHRLTVRGICRGVSTIGKHLSISGIRTGASGPPTLDGDGQGSVVTVKRGVRVAIEDLRIRAHAR